MQPSRLPSGGDDAPSVAAAAVAGSKIRTRGGREDAPTSGLLQQQAPPAFAGRSFRRRRIGRIGRRSAAVFLGKGPTLPSPRVCCERTRRRCRRERDDPASADPSKKSQRRAKAYGRALAVRFASSSPRKETEKDAACGTRGDGGRGGCTHDLSQNPPCLLLLLVCRTTARLPPLLLAADTAASVGARHGQQLLALLSRPGVVRGALSLGAVPFSTSPGPEEEKGSHFAPPLTLSCVVQVYDIFQGSAVKLVSSDCDMAPWSY
ncbi:hypothetical protein MRX96_004501 [Rhipicephalus microplus]